MKVGRHPETYIIQGSRDSSAGDSNLGQDTPPDQFQAAFGVAAVMKIPSKPLLPISNTWLRLIFKGYISLPDFSQQASFDSHVDSMGFQQSFATTETSNQCISEAMTLNRTTDDEHSVMLLENEELKAKIFSLEEELDQQKQRSTGLEKYMDLEKQRNEDLTKNLTTEKEEVKKWKKNQKSILKRQGDMRRNFEDTINVLEHNNTELKAEVDELQTGSHNLQDFIQNLQGSHQSMFERIGESFERVDKLSNENRNLSIKNSKLFDEINKLQNDPRLKWPSDSLQQRLEQYVKDATEVNQPKALAHLNDRIKDLNAQLQLKDASYMDQIEQLSVKNSQLQKENNFLILCSKKQGISQFATFYLKQSTDRGEKIQELEALIEELRGRLAILLSDKQDYRDEVEGFRRREKASEEKNTSLKMDIETLKQEKSTLQSTIEQMSVPLARFRQLMQATATDNPTMMDAASIAEAYSMVFAMAEKLHVAKGTCERAKTEAQDLRKKLLIHDMNEQARKSDNARIWDAFNATKHTLGEQNAFLQNMERELGHGNIYGVNQVIIQQLQDIRYQKEALWAQLENERTEKNKLLNILADYAEYYYDDQFNVTPSLYKAIAELKAENGEEYIIDPQDHPNPEVETKMLLRKMAALGNWHIDQSKFRPLDPNGNPGCITASYHALKKLLPLGWKAFFDIDRMWIKPMLEQFTHADVLERHEARQEIVRKQLCADMNLPEDQYGRVVINSVQRQTKEVLMEIPCDLRPEQCDTKQFDNPVALGNDPWAPIDPPIDGQDGFYTAQIEQQMNRFKYRFAPVVATEDMIGMEA